MSDPQLAQSSEKIQRTAAPVQASEAGEGSVASPDTAPHELWSSAEAEERPAPAAAGTAAGTQSGLVVDGVAMSRDAFRTAVETFYRTHNPEKLANVGTILERYKGKEEQLVRHLEQKYAINILKYLPQTSAQSGSTPTTPQLANTSKGGADELNDGSSSNPVSPGATSVGENASARITEGMQQMSQFTGKLLNAISMRTRAYMPEDGSNPEDNLWLARIRELENGMQQLQQEKQGMATSYQKLQTQLFNSKKDKQKLEAEVQDLKRQKATLQANVARLIESEGRLTQVNSEQAEQILQQQTKAAEFEHKSAEQEAHITRKDLQLKQCLELQDSMAAQLNFLTSRILLCHNITDWHTTPLMSEDVEFTSADKDLQEYSDEQLRNYACNLRAAWRASRAELREALAAKERGLEAIKQQHESSQTLEQHAASLNGQVDKMTQDLTELQAELSTLKSHHASVLRRLENTTGKVAEYEREVDLLKSQLCDEKTNNEIGQATRSNLVQVCTELVQDAQIRAGHTVSQLSERLLLEREDILSHFARVKFDEQQVREWCKKECEAELERLSTELFQSRQRETLKDRELRQLQLQLVDAAERIAKIESQPTRNAKGV